MTAIFIGSEAVSSSKVTRHELQRWYRRVYPGVYAPSSTTCHCATGLSGHGYGRDAERSLPV
ncbi:hypothetical protein BZL30_3562 [Mycobacterium kansasii]|uniref:Uncharacterized protein n=1 Tax=Mycobacterium kansasii TaxID=1768 RepID=A0A1V3XB17_MYCKA|nr:hypothetical protein BZL29_5179 [Mycobacterium kansasii]OOK76405.1 hypothetical protein BZL30_3562 [Mycobacterium kansasii]